jgi:hypothetical protein
MPYTKIKWKERAFKQKKIWHKKVLLTKFYATTKKNEITFA